MVQRHDDLSAREPIDPSLSKGTGLVTVVAVLSRFRFLSDLERRIIFARYGLDGSEPLTLREIGAAVHLTRERVRQIELESIRKLEGAEGLIDRHRDQILQLARRHGAAKVRVFGSIARGESDAKSDIDFIVDMEPGRSLFDLGGLQIELEELLGRKVDVVTERGLRPRVRERAIHEAIAL